MIEKRTCIIAKCNVCGTGKAFSETGGHADELTEIAVLRALRRGYGWENRKGKDYCARCKKDLPQRPLDNLTIGDIITTK